MALVTNIEKSQKDRQAVHRRTRCLYSVFVAADGHRYLQLDTFGTDAREFPDKVSQSIQFDENGARELKALIDATFPGLG